MQLNVSFSMAEGELIAVVEVFQILFFCYEGHGGHRVAHDSQIEVIVWLSLIVNILVICDKLGMDTT